MLAIIQLIGSIVLIVPQIPARFKEWAYGCFGVEFLCAGFSLIVLDEFTSNVIAVVVFLGILSTNYWAYHKLKI